MTTCRYPKVCLYPCLPFCGFSPLLQPKANTLQATVQKIVTEILPPSSGLAFGKDARDLLIECCVEFITLISSEANEISEKESKKTIACEHITKALEALGFGEYVQGILEVASEHKEQVKVSSSPIFAARSCPWFYIGVVMLIFIDH